MLFKVSDKSFKRSIRRRTAVIEVKKVSVTKSINRLTSLDCHNSCTLSTERLLMHSTRKMPEIQLETRNNTFTTPLTIHHSFQHDTCQCCGSHIDRDHFPQVLCVGSQDRTALDSTLRSQNTEIVDFGERQERERRHAEISEVVCN